MYALTNCKIFTGEEFITDSAVLTEYGAVVGICDYANIPCCEKIDCGGGLIVSGFIDLQVNGGGGKLFNDSPNKATVMSIYEAHRSCGTACICPTFITDSKEKLSAAIRAVEECDGDIIPAIHIEGFLISERKSGIHDKKYICTAKHDFLNQIMHIGSRRKILTIAPEELMKDENGIDVLLKKMSDSDIIVFGGHTDASYDGFTEFLNCGGVGATHLFNAMSQLNSRVPGVCGAVLDSERAVAGIIADGRHVSYACVRLAKRVMGERLFLVTDAMPPACSNMHEYVLYGQRISVKNGICVSENGTVAGSCISMLDAVRNCVENKVADAREALRMATLYPARVLKRDDLGRISPGTKALFTVINESLQNAYVLS